MLRFSGVLLKSLLVHSSASGLHMFLPACWNSSVSFRQEDPLGLEHYVHMSTTIKQDKGVSESSRTSQTEEFIRPLSYGFGVANDNGIERVPTAPQQRQGGLGILGTLSRTLSRAPTIDPGPPPDGGLQAWTQALMGHLVVFNTWG